MSYPGVTRDISIANECEQIALPVEEPEPQARDDDDDDDGGFVLGEEEEDEDDGGNFVEDGEEDDASECDSDDEEEVKVEIADTAVEASAPKAKGKGKATVEAIEDAAGKSPRRWARKAMEKVQKFLDKFPRLVQRPKGMHTSVDCRRPAAYTALDLGPSKVSAADPPMPNEATAEQRKAVACKAVLDIGQVLTGRRNQCLKYTSSAQAPLHVGAARRLKEEGPEEMARRVVQLMSPQTLVVLGRRKFSRSDLDDMPGFTAKMLSEQWFVYGLFPEMRNGKLKAYIGVSVNRDGGGKRIVDYEKCLVEAEQGYLRLNAVSTLLAETILSEDCVKVHARPLMCVGIPSAEEERKSCKAFLHDSEGLFSDLFQSLGNVSGTMELLGIDVDLDFMVKLSKEIAPIKEYDWEFGLNAVAPYRQGYVAADSTGMSAMRVVKAYRNAQDQDNKCPLDGRSLMNKEGLLQCRKNPFKDTLSWLPHAMICIACRNWLFVGPRAQSNHAQILAATDLDEAVAIRKSTLSVKQARSLRDYDDCPMCDTALVQKKGKTQGNPLAKHLKFTMPKVVCIVCANFCRTNLEHFKQLTSWDDCVTFRKAAFVKSAGAVLYDYELNSGPTCPACQKPFDSRVDAAGNVTSRTNARKTKKHLASQTPAGMPALVGIPAIGFKCAEWINVSLKESGASGRDLRSCVTLQDVQRVFRQHKRC